MSGLRIAAQIALARYRPVAVAAVLLGLVVIGGAVLLLKQYARTANLEREVDALRDRDPTGRVVAPNENFARLIAFERALGDRNEVDTYLRAVFKSAQQNGLRLDVGEYSMSAVSKGGYQRYELVLPVQGHFGSIQSFIQQILLGLPFASLEDIVVGREAVQTKVVEAKLRFALYLRANAPAASRSQTTASR